MTVDNTQKWILITGCSTGIGRHCALALHPQGYSIIASCRRQEDVERLQKEGLTVLPLDLRDGRSLNEAVEQIHALTGGKLYALFHNGAYGQPGALEDLPVAALREQFETNVFSWHELTRQLLPLLKASSDARLIYNSSVLGEVAMPLRGAYVASKFAIEGMADTLRLELADTSVKVVLIEPGPIQSQFRDNAYQAFMRHIDKNNSRFSATYDNMIARLQRDGLNDKFTLGPEAVLEVLESALTATNPRPRYRVTRPARVLPWLKRLLPTRMLDKLLLKAAD